jgi:ribosomal protein S18 acetylase RimI-like enzyme
MLLQWTIALQSYEAEHGKAMLPVVNNLAPLLGNWLNDLLSNPNSLILIAEDSQGPIGFILGFLQIQPNPFTIFQSHGIIQLVWVEERVRQQGIAAKLVEQMTTVLRESGAGYIEIQHIAANVPAVQFWQNQGYEACGVIRRKFL